VSWVDDAINTPEAVTTEFVKDHLPRAYRMIVLWTDEDGNVTYRASSMQVLEALGMLEMTKAMLFDYLNEEEDAIPE